MSKALFGALGIGTLSEKKSHVRTRGTAVAGLRRATLSCRYGAILKPSGDVGSYYRKFHGGIECEFVGNWLSCKESAAGISLKRLRWILDWIDSAEANNWFITDSLNFLSGLNFVSRVLTWITEEAPCGAQVFEEFFGLENGAVKSDKSWASASMGLQARPDRSLMAYSMA